MYDIEVKPLHHLEKYNRTLYDECKTPNTRMTKWGWGHQETGYYGRRVGSPLRLLKFMSKELQEQQMQELVSAYLHERADVMNAVADIRIEYEMSTQEEAQRLIEERVRSVKAKRLVYPRKDSEYQEDLQEPITERYWLFWI